MTLPALAQGVWNSTLNLILWGDFYIYVFKFPGTMKLSSCRKLINLQSHSLATQILSSSYCGYDVIVVGGGHAGTEAAHAAARMGTNTLLITHKINTIGAMSCNPSFGGIGKGHLMKEIDALDGLCGRACDETGVQYRMLNTKKGPAVWGPRAQIDRDLYKSFIQQELLNLPFLTIMESPVEDLLLKGAMKPDHKLMQQECYGVILGNGQKIFGKSVVLTTGTFLHGCITIGLKSRPAGRVGDEPAIGLAKSLENAGFKMGRLKTGTPPRLDGETIDYTKMTAQLGDDPPKPFSFLNEKVWIKSEDQLPCHITYTNEKVAKIAMDTLHLNKHVREEISGPRYCPSIESKIIRFGPKQHLIWLEPEGFNTNVVYPSGISCTMPEEHQVKMIRCIPGLEKCELLQAGYGVEYDYIDPRQLKASLETLHIGNLFFAGQINGTTGYEEAAAQGIIAGVNAASKVQKKSPLIIDRSEGYIGVMIDDLTTLGTNEPYRMFTSRAEFRLFLRPDNADIRLTEKGFHQGCVSHYRYEKSQNIQADLKENIKWLKTIFKISNEWREQMNLAPLLNKQKRSAFQMICDPQINAGKLAQAFPDLFQHLLGETTLLERLSIEVKYARDLQEQLEDIEEVRQDEMLEIPEDLDYYRLNIANEAKNKLIDARPRTIAAASRIAGVTPAALVALLRFVKKNQSKSKSNLYYPQDHIV